MDPICSSIDWKFDALNEYTNNFIKWKDSQSPGLTRETFSAFIQTVSGFKKLALSLIETVGFSYVLTGKINSDIIKRRFGQYRQMSGDNYCISTKNIFERKIKILSLLKEKSFTLNDLSEMSESNPEPSNEEVNFYRSAINLSYPDDDDNCIIFYVAGYIAHSI